MNLKTLVQDHWKGVLVGVAVMAATTYGGPVAGKAVGYLLPKALTHVSDTPISDIVARQAAAPPATATPQAPKVSTEVRSTIYRATLAQVAKDFGIRGRLDCRVVAR